VTAGTAEDTALPRDLTERPRLFVGGDWRVSEGGTAVEVHNPWDGAAVGTATLGSAADVDAAVSSARRSFDSGAWRDRTPGERADVLDRAADLLEVRLEELCLLVTSELGCPLSYSRRVHVPGPIRVLRYYAQMARTFQYEDQRSDGTWTSLVRRVPVGVVGAVTPWNGPISNPMMKLAPSLANGCSVVLKPSPETPLSAYAIADAMSQAGLPEGVLNIVPGGREVGEHLIGHRDVDKVAFTGSTAAGKRVMAACADRVARVTLELGGKSAAIVLADADLDSLVPALLPMAFMLNGQACISQTRVLVAQERERDLLDALAAAFTAQRVGDPLDSTTDIGPLVSSAQRDRVEGYVSLAATEGAQVVVGGSRPTFGSALDNGWFVSPTLLADVDNSMRVAREEIFGPVVSVIPFSDPREAVEIANDSVYGLSGSVWSTDPGRALEIAKQVRTGMVSINGHPQAFGTPLGGFKQSGMGRELGPEGFTPYLESQSIALGGRSR
jgi:aldehyde dehydrogenase (NAD+)